MPDTKLDLEELDLDTDLNKFDKKDKKPLNFNKDLKIFFVGYYYLLPNLNIFVDICRFRLFCSLLACSRRAVGDNESGSWITPQMWWLRLVNDDQLTNKEEGTAKTRTTTTTTTSNSNQN